MSHSLFLRHTAKPGRREDLAAVWRTHMPAAIEANDDHEAYVYTAAVDDPDVLWVYQQYSSPQAAAAFLQDPAYLAYLAESEELLAEQPMVVPVTPLWSKAVG